MWPWLFIALWSCPSLPMPQIREPMRHGALPLLISKEICVGFTLMPFKGNKIFLKNLVHLSITRNDILLLCNVAGRRSRYLTRDERLRARKSQNRLFSMGFRAFCDYCSRGNSSHLSPKLLYKATLFYKS